MMEEFINWLFSREGGFVTRRLWVDRRSRTYTKYMQIRKHDGCINKYCPGLQCRWCLWGDKTITNRYLLMFGLPFLRLAKIEDKRIIVYSDNGERIVNLLIEAYPGSEDIPVVKSKKLKRG